MDNMRIQKVHVYIESIPSLLFDMKKHLALLSVRLVYARLLNYIRSHQIRPNSRTRPVLRLSKPPILIGTELQLELRVLAISRRRGQIILPECVVMSSKQQTTFCIHILHCRPVLILSLEINKNRDFLSLSSSATF